jgi:predicted HicB family RNase H-like nuclease
MKMPQQETREAAMHVRVRPSVKAAAERLAQEDGRSLANWLERLIEAEVARRDGKNKTAYYPTEGKP